MWRIEYDRDAISDLRRLDRPVRARILDYVDELAGLDDPRQRGKALTGNLAGYWRYQIGDYRVICEIVDDEHLLYVIRIDHRRDVYRR